MGLFLRYKREGGECRAENDIYQATIKTDNVLKFYIGLRANQLKNVKQHTTPQLIANKTTKRTPVETSN